MTTKNNVFGKKLVATLLAFGLATGMLPLTQAQAAVISIFGDELLDMSDNGVTLTVKDEKHTIAKPLTVKDGSAWHTASGNVCVWLINGDMKVGKYSLQEKSIKTSTIKNVVDVNTTGSGTETRLVSCVTGSGETIDDAKINTMLSGSGNNSNTNNGSTGTGNSGTNTGTGNNANTGSGNNTGNNGTGTGNNGNTGSGTGNGTTTGSKISIVGNNGLIYNDGRNQAILSANKAIDKHIEVGNLLWVRFADGQISFWDLNQTNPTEVTIIEKGKSSSILLQGGKACYYDITGTLQNLPTAPVNPTTPTTPSTPSQAASKISLIGNDAIMYKNGDTQKILSANKAIDKHIEVGNLLWVRFADGQISFWDLNQTNPTEVIIIEKGKSSSILLQDGKASFYDINGVLQTLSTTPVNNPTTPTQPTNPTQPSGTGTSTAKVTYAYESNSNGVNKYLYNSKKQVVDKRKLAAGILNYSGKKIGNWTNVRWADFNKEGNLIATLKNGTYYSVNHNTLEVIKLGTNAKSRKFQRGLVTHIVTKSGAKKNVAHK